MIIEIFYAILLFSNFLISGLFVFMINRLIKSSELLGHKRSKIKVRSTNFDRKISINSIILSLLAVGFLFKLVPNILLLFVKPLPVSPFLDLLSLLAGKMYNHNSIKRLDDLKALNEVDQLIFLSVAMISFLSFILFILSVYFTIYRKMVIEGDHQCLKQIIFSLTICILFGIPLMLRLIIYNSTLGFSF